MSNNYDAWKELEKYFQEDPTERVESVPDQEINLAEKQLGVQFSEGYKKFVSLYGGAGLGSKLVYGLRHQENMDCKIFSVVDVTNFYREQGWPDTENWYVVSDDFDGNPIGIDPEGKVWLSDHNSGFELVKIADSFEELVHRLLTDTLFG